VIGGARGDPAVHVSCRGALLGRVAVAAGSGFIMSTVRRRTVRISFTECDLAQ
jgi:hypothetical protein